MEEEILVESDVADVTDICVINRYVICDRCKLLVPDVDNLEDHVCELESVTNAGDGEMVIESSPKGYQCEYCNKTFGQLSNLRRHERTHTGERPFVCETCNRGFVQFSNLKAHLRLHTGERPYICTQCGRSFTQSGNLYKHIRGHNTSVDETTRRRFGCLVCDRKFADNSVLQAHLRTHTGERPFSCDQCGRSFSQESNLRRHARIHSGVRPFVCSVCDRSFTQSNNLKAHMSLHRANGATADYQSDDGGGVTSMMVVVWPCDQCGAQFSQQSKLKRHQLSHVAPQVIVVTPSGLRISAQQVKLEDAAKVSTVEADSCDNSLTYVDAVPTADV